jgi:hypothetical protein
MKRTERLDTGDFHPEFGSSKYDPENHQQARITELRRAVTENGQIIAIRARLSLLDRS